jgi:hypothetical protein
MISTSKFTRVNQINRNKFGSYHHQNSSKYLNKVFEEITIEEIKSTPIKEVPIELPSTILLQEEEPASQIELLVLNKIETDFMEEVVLKVEPIIETNVITEPQIEEENHVELTELFDELPEENLVLTYINESFIENSIKKNLFLKSNFMRSRSWH